MCVCIRETKTAERHCSGLVTLLESCLKHNLQPSSKNEDKPHAKICADIISSIFLNYNKKAVMEVALPVAVKFLQKGNKELARNLASYLSLAAIEYAYLLSPHIQTILDSVISGNYGLCRVLPLIYNVSPEPLTHHAPLLVGLMSKCDTQEKLSLLNLFELIGKNKPIILIDSVQQLCEYLNDSTTVAATLMVILRMAEYKPNTILEHFDKIKTAALANPSTISLAAKCLSVAGKINKERAQFALDFVLEQLPNTDRASQSVLLNEATKLCSTYPILFTDKVLACVRKRNNMSQKQLIAQNDINKTSGGVTIVKLNSTTSGELEAQSHKKTTNSTSQQLNTHLAMSQSQLLNGGGNDLSTANLASQLVKPSFMTAQTSTGNTTIITNKTAISHVTTTVINTTTNQQTSQIPILTNGQHNQNQQNNHSNNQQQQLSYQPQTSTSPFVINSNVPPTPPHTGYTRRAKLGDSRSTGRLHPGSSNTHRSMTRLNIAGGSVGGLHKSMTRLSSSQQINNQSNGSTKATTSGGGSGSGVGVTTTNTSDISNSNVDRHQPTTSSINSNNSASHNYITPVPPLSSNVIVTGHNK